MGQRNKPPLKKHQPCSVGEWLAHFRQEREIGRLGSLVTPLLNPSLSPPRDLLTSQKTRHLQLWARVLGHLAASACVPGLIGSGSFPQIKAPPWLRGRARRRQRSLDAPKSPYQKPRQALQFLQRYLPPASDAPL